MAIHTVNADTLAVSCKWDIPREEKVMYRIGICDDDKALCAGLEEQIYRIAKEMSVKADVEVWYCGESILRDLQNGVRLDLLFLDIELLQQNGISVGRFIREEMEDLQTHIVYISSRQGYAMQLFRIQPLDFLISRYRMGSFGKSSPEA